MLRDPTFKNLDLALILSLILILTLMNPTHHQDPTTSPFVYGTNVAGCVTWAYRQRMPRLFVSTSNPNPNSSQRQH